MAPLYQVKVASSIYMDSDGTFSSSAAAGVPVIPSRAFTLPIDPTKVATALTAISDTVKKYTDSKNTESLLLRRIGIAGEALKMFQQLGNLTGQLAKFVPYVSAAVEVLKAFNILSGGSDTVSPAMQQRFDQLNQLIIAGRRQWADVTSAGFQNRVLTSLDSVTRYAEQTLVWANVPASQVNWTTLDAERTLHRTVSLQDAHSDLLTFLNPSLWQSERQGRDPDDPERTFDPLRPLFLALPDENDVWHPAPGEHEGIAVFFDHRMLVHVVPSLVASYLTMIRTLLPEFRSVGTYRTKLLAVATEIEALMDMMRTKNLARTDYSGISLADQGELFGIRIPGRFDIGGYDLAASRTLPYGWTEWPQTGWWDTSATVIDVGALTFNWPIPNLDDAGRRAALEAETAVRYGQMLYSSGYLQLAQAAALLRHLSVAPDVSETVAAGFHPTRGPVEMTSATTVTSRPAFPFPELTTRADRRDSKVVVDAVIRTQSPLNSQLDPLPYRVYLRTLPARTADCRSDYSTTYWTGRDPGDQGREPSLVCHYTGASLDDHLVVEGISPRQVRARPDLRVVTLTADTFQVWQPVPDVLARQPVSDAVREAVVTSVSTAAGTKVPPQYVSAVDRIVDLRRGVDLFIPPQSGDPVSITAPTDRELGPATVPEPHGQRRNLAAGRPVSIAYRYAWDGARLDLHLEVPATSPNFDVYLVVEELIVRDQRRHNAFLLPMVPQITYVPQSFLEREAEQSAKAQAFWTDLNRRYALSDRVGPEDPIIGAMARSVRNAEQRMAVAELFRQHAPDVLERAIAEWGPVS